MPFDWKEYLRLAEELSTRQEDAALRSAISRAYYAAFCSARNHLQKQGEPLSRSGDSHKAVWESFQRKGRSYATIYQHSHRLKNDRRKADYEDEVRNLSESVVAALRSANAILHWLEQLAAQDSSG